MFGNTDLRQNMEFGYGDGIDININNTNTNQNVNMNENTNMNMNMNTTEGFDMGTPIIEPGRERVVQRNIVHEVKQYIPLLNNNFS